jgi:hypothetical protein
MHWRGAFIPSFLSSFTMPHMNTGASGGLTSVMAMLAAGLNPLQALWFQFVQYIPQIIAAIIILAVGWALGVVIGGLVTRVVRFSGVDNWVKKAGLNERFKLQHGSQYALLSGLVGSFVKWLIILAAIGVAAGAANLPQIGQFVGAIFAYIPNVIVAVIILAIGFAGATFASDFVAAGVARFPVGNRDMIASIVRYAIIIFSIMAALTQLQIVPNLIQILFAGLVLALALAFGLGGRDHANDAIRRLREQTQ